LSFTSSATLGVGLEQLTSPNSTIIKLFCVTNEKRFSWQEHTINDDDDDDDLDRFITIS